MDAAAASNTAVLGAGGDRLSSLGDATLGHILSFLPAAEAARAAALSRRWRRIFPAAVHTLSFREAERPLSSGYKWFQLCDYCDRGEPWAPRFATRVSAALLARGGAAAPLRALRVAFDEFGYKGGDARTAVDGWLSHAGGALELDLCLDKEPICKHPYKLLLLPQSPAAEPALPAAIAAAAAAEHYPYPRPDEYVTPRSLFSSAVLRSLRLGGCRLDLPSAIALPSLDTLHLTRVTGPSDGGGGAVQRLVSACPRLAELTLEACRGLAEVAVHGARLRRLALRCCHELAAVAADSSELRAFEYRGGVPASPWFLSMEHPHKLSFCALDFCGEEPAAAPELGFLQLFAGVERLHLTSARLGRGVVGHGVFPSGIKFPAFPALRNLELTGMLPDGDAAAVAAVTRILERTPSLETLSLFFLPQPHPVTDRYYNDHADVETIHASHKLRYDRHAPLAVPEGEEITCLREKMREINLVHYQGAMAQRLLAKFLLRNAMVVDEVCCEFARGPLLIQNKLMEEIQGWVMNKSANMMFF